MILFFDLCHLFTDYFIHDFELALRWRWGNFRTIFSLVDVYLYILLKIFRPKLSKFFFHLVLFSFVFLISYVRNQVHVLEFFTAIANRFCIWHSNLILCSPHCCVALRCTCPSINQLRNSWIIFVAMATRLLSCGCLGNNAAEMFGCHGNKNTTI